MDNGTEEIADFLHFVISDRSKDDLVVQKAIILNNTLFQELAKSLTELL